MLKHNAFRLFPIQSFPQHGIVSGITSDISCTVRGGYIMFEYLQYVSGNPVRNFHFLR